MLYVGVYSSSWTYSINVSWNKLLQRETSALCRVRRAELPPLNSIMLSHLASTTGPVCCGRGSVWTQRANRVKAQHLDKCHKLVGKFNHAFFFLFFLGDLSLFVSVGIISALDNINDITFVCAHRKKQHG